MAQRYATRDDVAGPAGDPGGVAPLLNPLDDEHFDTWLPIAAEHIGLQRWGNRASYGHALLTAHYLQALVGPAGTGGKEAGPLMAEANGPASRSFGNSGAGDAEDFSTTPYGRAFIALRKVVSGRGFAVVANSCVRQRP